MSLKTVGAFIRYKREQLGLSRPEFEANYHVTAGSLANWEGGHSRPSSAMLSKFADIFDVTPGIFLDLLEDATTLEQAVAIDQELDVIIDKDGSFTVKLPKTFDTEDIKDVQKYIDFVQYKKEQGQSQTKTFGKVTDQDLVDTSMSLPTDQEMEDGEVIAKEIETKGKEALKNKRAGKKN